MTWDAPEPKRWPPLCPLPNSGEPLVSVVVPAYNAADTIETTVVSALSQTHANVEVLAIDDGSTDDTRARLEALASLDNRLTVWSFANAGQAIGRNRGAARARGEFVAFLDADDYWSANKIAAQVAALQQHPEAAVAYCWTDYVDASCNFLHRGSYVAASGKVLAALLVLNFIENGSNVLVRREALAAAGAFEPSVVPSEDWDLWLRLAAQFEFVAVPEARVFYRVVSTSQSANVLRLERSGTACLDRALDRHPALEPLRNLAYANFYKYLTYKILEGAPADRRPRSRLGPAWRLFRTILRHDRRFWRAPVTGKILLRLGAIALLPRSRVRQLLAASGAIGRPFNVDSLLGYIQRPE